MTLKEIVIFTLILLFALFSRLFRLGYPGSMYFDEVYHVPAAMMLGDGNFQTPFDFSQSTYDGQNVADWLHPPLAKYFQALSMDVFGKNPVAWRLPSLVFSMGTMVVFYFLLRFIAYNFLFKDRSTAEKQDSAVNMALLGSFFFSLDFLFFVQSRIAMNDVFLLFFLVSAILLYCVYLRDKKPWLLFLTGVVLALALATKWTALWIILLIFAKEFLVLKDYKKLPFLIFSLLLTPIFIYVLSYLPMFIGGRNLADFLLLQKTIAISHLSNPSTHLYSSKPLAWIFNLRSVWFFTADRGAGLSTNIYALENPLLNLYYLLALLLTTLFLFMERKASLRRKILSLLFLLYLFSFAPWLIFSRLMFIYHYLPAMPFLIALLSYFLINFFDKIEDQKQKRAIVFNVLFWPFFIFILFYPHLTALSVPTSFANAVYFLLPFWR